MGVTEDPADRGAFLTPTLRNVARTPPYMHDGGIPDLESVVDFYAAGGTPNANLDREIRAFSLTAEERESIVVFLRTLTSPAPLPG
jgi:cytochrome c peroxidase